MLNCAALLNLNEVFRAFVKVVASAEHARAISFRNIALAIAMGTDFDSHIFPNVGNQFLQFHAPSSQVPLADGLCKNRPFKSCSIQNPPTFSPTLSLEGQNKVPLVIGNLTPNQGTKPALFRRPRNTQNPKLMEIEPDTARTSTVNDLMCKLHVKQDTGLRAERAEASPTRPHNPLPPSLRVRKKRDN